MGFWLVVILFIAVGKESRQRERGPWRRKGEINGRRVGQAFGIPQQAAC
ncbi:TPA: hypothetical protein ACK1J8_003282 [Klebsiella quasipneumoniae]|nr:hypothetical protein [Klebsiella quasipneumoniae]MCU8821520.1 hypothetical protein [Klebsiella quasipneumoniae]MDH1960468.1 hypothetical protein [Klebsiella quasipneumoniae]MEC5637899.1 hypothetical protein [Klebsiella quasipneumoniae]QYD19418.1 hypothetical protein KZX49_15250 [Klebsiella quasipneumoniae]UDC64020.1 hypothetical protein LGM21_15020 [Klebsiella quasipneumoniae subsp. quasipneumoniae]